MERFTVFCMPLCILWNRHVVKSLVHPWTLPKSIWCILDIQQRVILQFVYSLCVSIIRYFYPCLRKRTYIQLFFFFISRGTMFTVRTIFFNFSAYIQDLTEKSSVIQLIFIFLHGKETTQNLRKIISADSCQLLLKMWRRVRVYI